MLNFWTIRLDKGASSWRKLSPPQLFVGSFALLIALGTLGLRLLPGLYVGERLGWVDSLFTATSAVSITGLSVVDTATYFTFAGQAVILLLIQLGGLGMITFTSLIIIALGRRLSLRQESLSSGAAEVVAPNIDVQILTRNVFRFTFGIEAVGALALYALWIPRFGVSGAVWPAIFHSVSAFCNAGFSTFTESLMGFQLAPVSLVVIMALIITGGIGFLTLVELDLNRRARGSNRMMRISLHSRLVLATTLILIIGGWLGFTFFEWRVTLASLPPWARVVNGLFMSVTARTAGFNNVDYTAVASGSAFLTIILMSIGGSPGSMAGGIKTTTFALIALLAWSRFRGSEHASIWGRTIPAETIQRAVGLFVFAFGLVTLAIFVLASTELGRFPHHAVEGGFLKHMFEAVSAFNTVGLSMDTTGTLSAAGKITAIVLMYLGRVGPLTFASAIAMKRTTSAREFRYAHEDVVVG